jgi:hypothetical protein
MFHAAKEERKEWPLLLDSDLTAAGSAGGRLRDKDYCGDSCFDCKPSDYATSHERLVYF